jgi:hypothetical protein
MPSPKRWFAMSRTINDDPEVWALEDQFGPHALRLWMELLAKLDEHDNQLRIDADFIKVVARKVRLCEKNVVGSILWMVVNAKWLTVTSETEGGNAALLAHVSHVLDTLDIHCPSKDQSFSNARSLKDLLFINERSFKVHASNWRKYNKTRETKIAAATPS